MRYIFIIFFIFSTAAAQQNKLDSLFADQKDFSGVILVAENGKSIYQKAIGYREFANQSALQKTDIFELASVSKQLLL